MRTILQRKKIERVAVLIPAYCEQETIGGIVSRASNFVTDVIVVDDASTDDTIARAEAAGAIVIKRKENGGKGITLTEGFRYVLAQGYDAVISMDGDGFYSTDYIQTFLDTYYRTHIPVLVGNRMAFPERIFFIRRISIKIMTYWLYRLYGVYVQDPPCGFRFYRCDALPFLLESASALPIEFETLLCIASHRIRIGSVSIKKKTDRHKTLISPFRDLVRFAKVLRKHFLLNKRKNTRRQITLADV